MWLTGVVAWVMTRWARSDDDEAGQGTVEYALVIGVGVVLAITALTAAAPNLQSIITDALTQARDALNLP